MNRLARSCVVATCVLAFFSLTSGVAYSRNITEKDLFRFTWIADPQVSPDGTRVAFVQVTVNEEADKYETSIWSVAMAGNEPLQRLTAGPRDTAPRWSPDGKRLAFLRGTEKEDKPQPGNIWLLPLGGGEPWQISFLPKGVQSLEWSPDGKTIAFTSKTKPADMKAPDEKPGRQSDVRVVTRAVYRSNSQGYLDPARPAHIWVITVPNSLGESNTPKQLTTGPFEENSPIWSPDSKTLYYTSRRDPEPYYRPGSTDIYSIPATGGEATKIASVGLGFGGDNTEIALSPDGKRLAFRGAPNEKALSYRQPDLFLVNATPGVALKNLTADFDFDISSGLTGDQRAPRGSGAADPLWSADGRSVMVVVAREGRTNLHRVDTASGKVTPVTQGDQEVMAYSASPDRSKLVVLISTPTNIGDLYAVEANGSLRRLTNVNEKLFAEVKLTPPEEVWYTSFDGKKVHTWVQKPPDFDPKKKYPLILNIHGGPHAAYGYTFDHEFQWMAAKGYVVLYPNPRGSTSYGQDFGNIIQYRFPGDDHKDLMAGVDELIRRGYIDEKKLGITGGSGGGLLTNWAITQTDRFAAAVSQRSIGDWAAWWYSADFTLFQPNWFKAAPWQDTPDYAARSPISHVDKIKTPLMLIDGEVDYRTPPAAGGETMFRALKFLKKPVVMVRFPEESHELSRSGKPWHRIERLQHMLNWFDKYLLGKQVSGYEVTPEEGASRQAKSD
ncbi:MAG: S9 family peptidase [Acidobacteriales bacterium]|nr:S9 family peptidase [Terriglobales bacterium]